MNTRNTVFLLCIVLAVDRVLEADEFFSFFFFLSFFFFFVIIHHQKGGNYQPQQQPRQTRRVAEAKTNVFLNVSEPFCLVALGVQGAGKSHSLGVVLESCLIAASPVITLSNPLTALVMHYDSCETNICEAVTVSSILPQLPQSDRLTPPRGIIYVSPSFYHQRSKFYEGSGWVVRPLLFAWSSLTASHIKTLMCLKDDEIPLYASVLLERLRLYQRKNKIPNFVDFIGEAMQGLTSGQEGPLNQRFKVLNSFVAESDINREDGFQATNLREDMTAGTVIIADLTDPLLSPPEANSIFQVRWMRVLLVLNFMRM